MHFKIIYCTPCDCICNLGPLPLAQYKPTLYQVSSTLLQLCRVVKNKTRQGETTERIKFRSVSYGTVLLVLCLWSTSSDSMTLVVVLLCLLILTLILVCVHFVKLYALIYYICRYHLNLQWKLCINNTKLCVKMPKKVWSLP